MSDAKSSNYIYFGYSLEIGLIRTVQMEDAFIRAHLDRDGKNEIRSGRNSNKFPFFV